MTTLIAPADVTLPDDRSVLVTRDFHASAPLVFRAYTDPDLLVRWLVGSDGWEMTRCDVDLRVGGSYRWEWTHVDSKAYFGFFGDFLEIDAPHRIVNSETFDPGTLGGDMGKPAQSEVTFVEKNGVTTLTTRITYPDQASRDMALSTGMTDGMEQSYQRLDTFIEGDLQP
ncbi:SRPBCC family protein [Marivita hallyeonensis]|uniref:Uncharacterized conserved protein YndB, AHSA1/START domain n=1 Tax=Marivita hallyeonensis TaxID=996342 RepID=A0A1M5W890_9RHOB|nr:SRPBCC family protein [Marivita hallyeonensis]SHH83404.1 Uncharacterized conserved protein YndB, AHSA1/START domain [Marivita hallyeonensis]